MGLRIVQVGVDETGQQEARTAVDDLRGHLGQPPIRTAVADRPGVIDGQRTVGDAHQMIARRTPAAAHRRCGSGDRGRHAYTDCHSASSHRAVRRASSTRARRARRATRRQMDLNTVEAGHIPTRATRCGRSGPADAVLAGGTWLFSEPQPTVTRLVDITGLGWPPVTLDPGRDRTRGDLHARRSRRAVNAHCPRVGGRPAVPAMRTRTARLVQDLAHRDLGGNICLSFAGRSDDLLRSGTGRAR